MLFAALFIIVSIIVGLNCDHANSIQDSLYGLTVYFGSCPTQSRKVVRAVDSSSVCRSGSTFYCDEYCAKRFNKEDEEVMGGKCLQSRTGYRFGGYVGYGATCVCIYCKGHGTSDSKCTEEENSEVLPEDNDNVLCSVQSAYGHKACTEKCLTTFINAEKGLCRKTYEYKYECVCRTCGPAERFNRGFCDVPGTVDCRDIAPPLHGPTCVWGRWNCWSECNGHPCLGIRHRTRHPITVEGDCSGASQESELCTTKDCSDPRTEVLMPPPEVEEPEMPQSSSGPSPLLAPTTTFYLPVGITKQTGLCNAPSGVNTVACTAACVQAFKQNPVSNGYCFKAFKDEMGNFRKRCVCEICNYPPCIYGSWNGWSFCSARCGGGTRRRKRPLLAGDRNVCTDALQYRTCNSPPCRIDCVVAQWADWSDCSSKCGVQKQSRQRRIIVPPLYGGKCSYETVQYRSCNPRNVCD